MNEAYVTVLKNVFPSQVCEKLFDWSYFDHWMNSGVQLQEHGDIGMMTEITDSLKGAAKSCHGKMQRERPHSQRNHTDTVDDV